MKIRAGFVSNSSSSSFMAVGIKLTNEQFEKLTESLGDDKTDELHDTFTILHGSEGGLSDNNHVAITKSFIFSDDTESGEFGIDELPKIVEKQKLKIEELMKEHNLNGEIKIFHGTRMC